MELEMNLGFPWPPGIRETRRVREDERGNIGTRGGGSKYGEIWWIVGCCTIEFRNTSAANKKILSVYFLDNTFGPG